MMLVFAISVSNVVFLLYGLYRAFNRPGMSLVLTFFSLGTRVTLAYLLSAIPSIEVKGIRWAVPIGWLLADFVGVTYYLCFCRTKLYREERGGGSSDAETVVYQKRKG